MAKPEQYAEVIARLAGQAPAQKLLTYNPGPGIYSRLERAVEAMPENVRVQELPGLLKRYKDGVPGWELKAADLDSTIAGRDVVPREELLGAVRERSPVYTHRESLLAEDPNKYPTTAGGLADLAQRYYRPGEVVGGYGGYDKVLGFDRSVESPWEWSVTVVRADPQGNPMVGERPRTHRTPPDERAVKDWFGAKQSVGPQPLGKGQVISGPLFGAHSQGGDNYTELLLSQPKVPASPFGSHWESVDPAAVAHARFDTHGDALRINELQSDLGIHNRKMREQYPSASTGDADELPLAAGPGYKGPATGELPFPLEDAWSDILIKRLALEAARQGHRAIEVASPRAIADKVGGNIENYEHFYGKVVPGAIARLGRKMGGLTPAPVRRGPEPVTGSPYQVMPAHHRAQDAFVDLQATADQYMNPQSGQVSTFGILDDMVDAMSAGEDATPLAERLRRHMLTHAVENGWPASAAEIAVNRDMPGLMRKAENWVHLRNQKYAIANLAREMEPTGAFSPPPAPGRRYIMSDEMRRRILLEGIPASVAGAIGTDQILDRLDRDSPQPQLR